MSIGTLKNGAIMYNPRLNTSLVLFARIVIGCDYYSTDGDSFTEDTIDDNSEISNGMRWIPGGKVLIGSDTTECNYDQPMHEAYVDSYYIDINEVTNGSYEECVLAGACLEPTNLESLTRIDYYANPEYYDYPVINIDWERAESYCRWKMKRLPTEAEWEKAARGGCELRGDAGSCEEGLDSQAFPWGDDAPTCEISNASRGCVGDTTRIGTYSQDKSPYDVIDMGGNAAEWVSDFFVPEYNEYHTYINPTGPTEEQATGQCPIDTELTCHVKKMSSFAPNTPDRIKEISCRGVVFSGYDMGFRCAY